MVELYNDLKPHEIENIEKNWPTTLENLKKQAELHDAKEAIKNGDVRPEDRRTKQDNKLLEELDFEKILDMYSDGEKAGAKEYQTNDPYALQQN